MVKKVVITETFFDSLREYYLFICKDSIKRANIFYSKCIDSIESISQFPNIGIKQESFTYYYVFHKNYSILYENLIDSILFLNLLHSRKNNY